MVIYFRSHPLHHGTLLGYTQMFESRRGVQLQVFRNKSTVSDTLALCAGNTSLPCPYILGDFTPRYLVDGYDWQRKWYHRDKVSPQILVPQKLQLLLPQVKVIVMLREPAERLLSSYTYFELDDENKKTQEEFERRALGQIKSWSRCVRALPVRNCMYGYPSPSQLDPPLGQFWATTSHDQLRYGLYHLYLEEWFKVFPRNQFLILRFEDYIKSPIETINKQVLPFLGLEPYYRKTLEMLEVWEKQKKVYNSKSSFAQDMLPSTRRALHNFYKPYNRKLAALLNDTRYLWNDTL